MQEEAQKMLKNHTHVMLNEWQLGYKLLGVQVLKVLKQAYIFMQKVCQECLMFLFAIVVLQRHVWRDNFPTGFQNVSTEMEHWEQTIYHVNSFLVMADP